MFWIKNFKKNSIPGSEMLGVKVKFTEEVIFFVQEYILFVNN